MVERQDIFISYAHVDNVPLPGVARGWVTNFVEGRTPRPRVATTADDMARQDNGRSITRNRVLTLYTSISFTILSRRSVRTLTPFFSLYARLV